MIIVVYTTRASTSKLFYSYPNSKYRPKATLPTNHARIANPCLDFIIGGLSGLLLASFEKKWSNISFVVASVDDTSWAALFNVGFEAAIDGMRKSEIFLSASETMSVFNVSRRSFRESLGELTEPALFSIGCPDISHEILSLLVLAQA